MTVLMQSSSASMAIALTAAQIGEFAGNALELSNGRERLLALSNRALASLSADQVQYIERSARIVPLDVPTIELAGGSVRCMLAGIHLARREISQEKSAVTA